MEALRQQEYCAVDLKTETSLGNFPFAFFFKYSRKLAELAVVTLAESKYRLGVAVWQGQGGSPPNA